MKKLFILVSLACLFLVSGCGEKKKEVLCTLESNNIVSDYKLSATYKATIVDDHVTKVKTTEKVESKDQSILDSLKTTIEDSYKKMNEAYGGYQYKSSQEGDLLTVTTNIDYTILDMDKFIKDNSVMKGYVNKKNQITIEGIQKLYESMGATCEVK